MPAAESPAAVLIERSSVEVLPTVRVVQVGTDWSFTMKNLGGPFMFRIVGIPDDWMMAWATLGESDIAGEHFDVSIGGREITGARIAVALDYLDEGRHEDAALLAELRDTATSFTLGEGATRALTFTTQQLPTPDLEWELGVGMLTASAASCGRSSRRSWSPPDGRAAGRDHHRR